LTLSIAVIITGILFILVPHFVLPLGYIKGGTGAMLLSECSVWYHPEIYLGVIIAFAGVMSLKDRRYLRVSLVSALPGIVHAFVLRPTDFYFATEEPLVVLAQTYSIRAHAGIRTAVLLLSAATLVLSAVPLVAKKRRKAVNLSISHIAAMNLKRRRFRSLAMIISLTIVIGALFSEILLTRSIENTLELGAGRLGADLMVVPKGEERAAQAVLLSGGPTMFYLKKDIVEKLNAFPEIEKLSPQLYVQPFSYKVCCIVESVLIIAYDPETDFTVAPWIRYSLKSEQGLYDIVVGKLVKFYPGQDIDLFGRKLHVVASLEPTGLGYFDNSAFIPLSGARRLLSELKKREEVRKIPTRQEILDDSFSHLFASDREKRIQIKDIDVEGISAVFIKARDHVSVKDLKDRIESSFGNVSVINVKESTVSVKRHLTSMLRAFLVPILIVLVMGTLILGVIFSMSVNERLREIGLLRAMGARRKDIFKLVIAEAMTLAGIGGVFGILFGSSLIFLFKNRIMAALELLYIWPSPPVIINALFITLMTSFLAGMAAGIYPAVRASRMEPYLAIRKGE